MIRALFALVVLAILAAAWRAGLSESPPEIRRRVRAAFGLALLLGTLLALSRMASPGAAGAVAAYASAAVALALLWTVAHLALGKPFGRADRIVRLVSLGLCVLLLIAGSSRSATAFFLALGLSRFPWLRPLDTGERFRAMLAALVVAVVLLLGDRGAATLVGPAAAAGAFARLVRTATALCAIFGTMGAFGAFASDPTLGVRRVGRRLALSHVLVAVVPLLIVVTLWITSTYLGVNADRALVAARAVDREAQRIEESLRIALRAGGDADVSIRAVAADRRVQWPGTRAFVVRGDSVRRVAGDGVDGEPTLAAWCARLDSLPRRGIVQIADRRWLGAAASEAGVAAVALVPIAEALDSTLSTMVGARVSMRELMSRRVAPDTAARGSLRRGRSPVILAGRDTLSLQSNEIGLTGQSLARGLTHDGRKWDDDVFALTARASLRSTLVGLFSNVRENPLQSIPLLALFGLGLLLFPIAQTDLRLVRGMGASITQGIHALREGARAFGSGRLDHRIPVAGDDDLWDTARQFNQMAEDLGRARELEKERDRFENELELARRIHRRLLPAGPPAVPGLDVAGLSESAREVGGDYYDHIEIGEGRLLLVIADVSGKGVPAALLMSGFRASLMSQDASRLAPDAVARRLNDFLHRSVEPGRFVTAFLGFLDAATGRFVYVNAGHNPPVLLRRDGSVEMLAEGGLILGIVPDSTFATGDVTLAPGDLVALYTDGVTEGADAANEQWGEERLVASLRAAGASPAAGIAERIVREVRAFEGESGPADDITVLVVRRTLPA